jgi:hypothetical protein
MGEQGEELEGAAQSEVGKLRQHPGSLHDISGGVTLPRHDQANQQLTGHVRVSAPYGSPSGADLSLFGWGLLRPSLP